MPSEAAVDYAVKHLTDFARVQGNGTFGQQVNAFNRFAEAVGIGDELKDYLNEEISLLLGEDSLHDSAHVYLGVILGLLMAEYESL